MVFPELSFRNNSLYSQEKNDIFIQYPELNEINVEVTTDKFVEYHNADKVVKNTYFWTLTAEEDKKIEISFKDKEQLDYIEKLQEKTKEIEKDKISNFSKYILIFITITLMISVIWVTIKFKNSNKK